MGIKSHHFRVKIQIVARMGDDSEVLRILVRMKGLEPSRTCVH